MKCYNSETAFLFILCSSSSLTPINLILLEVGDEISPVSTTLKNMMHCWEPYYISELSRYLVSKCGHRKQTLKFLTYNLLSKGFSRWWWEWCSLTPHTALGTTFSHLILRTILYEADTLITPFDWWGNWKWGKIICPTSFYY